MDVSIHAEIPSNRPTEFEAKQVNEHCIFFHAYFGGNELTIFVDTLAQAEAIKAGFEAAFPQ